MIKKICRYPCCSGFAIEGQCYCEKHYKPRVPFVNATRANDLFYQSQQWRKLRTQALEKTPFCCICGATTNLSVDHITPPRGNEELFFDPYNLQVLCSACHNFKTSCEIAERNQKQN